MPVSSSFVIKASKGPCLISLDSNTAMIAATPRPSSAPRVVPFARTHSPSIHVWMGSLVKLCSTSATFCGTISMWACSTTPLRFSMPGVAGLRITTLPALSIKDSRPRFLPKFTKNSLTCSQCPDGRGICVSA